MAALLSLLVILALSLLITKIASVALTHTGLSRESARFQARSAFTGVGFTTYEAENVVRHPLRRRIVMWLMFLGNVGLVSAISSLMLTFIDDGTFRDWLPKSLVLVAAIAVLWGLASSQWVDVQLSRLIDWALTRFTDIEVRDYAGLLRLSGDYQVTELEVEQDDWMAGRTLAELKLRDEGVQVLGITRSNGKYIGVPRGQTRVCPADTLILYGRAEQLHKLDERRAGHGGEREHEEAVSEQRRQESAQQREDPAGDGEATSTDEAPRRTGTGE